MTSFKQWLDTRNKTHSPKGDMVEALKVYEHPSFVLRMWQGEYEPPGGLTSKEHLRALTRLVWEAERAGCNIDGEVSKVRDHLGVSDDDDIRLWSHRVDQDAEWENNAPVVAEKGARVQRIGSEKDRRELAKALGLTLPNTRQGVEYRYLAAIKALLDL